MPTKGLTPSKIRKGRAMINKRRKRIAQCAEAADRIRKDLPLAAEVLDAEVRFHGGK